MQLEEKDKIEIEQIVKGCKKGKQKAQKELYDRFSSMLFGLCLRYCKNKEDAEDVFQEGFIKVFSQIEKLENNEAIIVWMRLIFIRTALNYYRKDKPSADIEDIDIKFENKNLDDVYSKLSLKELMEKIQSLPSKRRLIFNMVEIEGYSYSEISQILDIAESTIRVQNYKAKQELKRLIEKDNNIDIR